MPGCWSGCCAWSRSWLAWVLPLFGWIVAFAVAIRFAVLARRAVQPSLFRVAGWAMFALGLVNVAVIAVRSSGSDQVELTRNSGLGLNRPGVAGVDPDDYRSGLALAGEQLAQREAELARIVETSAAVTAQLDAGTKLAGASTPTTCSITLFDQRGQHQGSPGLAGPHGAHVTQPMSPA